MKPTTKTHGTFASVASGKSELESLNSSLYTEFSLQQLEQRLETKTWGCEADCGSFTSCPDNSCAGYLDLSA